MLTRNEVFITIRTVRQGLPIPIFPLDGMDGDEEEEYDEPELPETDAENTDEPEEAELMMEGHLIVTSRRAELVYKESELTGMEGSVTKIGFDRNHPELLTMIRGGSVSTALVFEKGKRHMCVYTTPFSSLEVCVQTLDVQNHLLDNGMLFLDYLVEIHGARTERCKLTLNYRKADKDPVCRG